MVNGGDKGNGAGKAYRPYPSKDEAEVACEKLFSKWAEENESTPEEFRALTLYPGPWIDVLEINNADNLY